MKAAAKRAKRARDSRARDTDCSSVTSTSTLDDSHHRLQHHPLEPSTTIKHIKYDAGAYEGFKEEKERDQLNPEQTANGTDFTGIQVPKGAPKYLLCEECERRNAVGFCEDCGEALCAACLAILHIPSTGGQAHPHLAQARTKRTTSFDGIRSLRAGDESSVVREEEDPIPAHEVDEDEMATRRDLSVPTSLEAPTIDLTSRTAKRNAAEPLHKKGQLVVFRAALADSLPDHLAGDDEEEACEDHENGMSVRRRGSRPRELYGEVMSVPMARHGEWGHARRRTQGHRLLVRVRVLGRASGGYSEPFVEEWQRRKHQREGPREPVKITGGSGADPLAREVGAAKAKDVCREGVRRTCVLPEKELPLINPPPLPTNTSIAPTPAAAKAGTAFKETRSGVRATGRSRSLESGTVGGVEGDDRGGQALVVLVPEEELFPVEVKREELRRSRCAIVEACYQSAERRRKADGTRAALKRWLDTTVEIRNERWEWASRMLQRRTRGNLVRIRCARQREAQERVLWEAGRRLHKQFRYLDTQASFTRRT
ncbi:unnamed protein product [Ectocarpus sp. 8 AP-2014]